MNTASSSGSGGQHGDSGSLLLEEYKLIQAKIDKLGEDKFKVRSWCFTLLTGVVVAMRYFGILEISWVSLWILLMLLPAVFAFHLVELRQRQLSKRLGYRAAAIERTWRGKKYDERSRSATPQLATFLIQEGRVENARCSIFAKLKALAVLVDRKLYPEKTSEVDDEANKTGGFRAAPPKRVKPERPPSLKECLIVNAEDLFYAVQYFLVIVFAIFLVRAILKNDPAPQHDNAPRVQSNSGSTNISDAGRSLNGDSK